jgi:hypothetical protein
MEAADTTSSSSNTSSGDGAWQVQNSTKPRRLAPQSFISKSSLGAPPG